MDENFSQGGVKIEEWMDESGLYSAFNHSWSYHHLQVVGVYVLDPSCPSLNCGQSL